MSVASPSLAIRPDFRLWSTIYIYRARKWKKSISLPDGSSLESYLNNEVDKAGVMRGKRGGLRGAKGKSGLSMSLNKGLDESEIRSSELVPEGREGSSLSPVCHDYGQSSARWPTAGRHKSGNERSVPPNEADVVSVRVAVSEVNDDVDVVAVRKDFVEVATNDLEVDGVDSEVDAIENESSGAEVNDVSETVDDVGHAVGPLQADSSMRKWVNLLVSKIELLEKDLAEQKAKNECLELRLSSLEKLYSSTECAKSHDSRPPRPNPEPTTSNLINAENLVVIENVACSKRVVNCRGGRSHSNRNRSVGSPEVGEHVCEAVLSDHPTGNQVSSDDGQKWRNKTRLGATKTVLMNKAQGEGDRATFGKSHRSGDCYVGKRKLWGTRKSDTKESVQRKVEGALGTRGEVKVRRVEDNGKGEQGGTCRWWFWLEGDEAVLRQLERELSGDDYWKVESTPFLVRVRVLPKRVIGVGRGNVGT